MQICVDRTEFFNVKPGGTSSNQWATESYI